MPIDLRVADRGSRSVVVLCQMGHAGHPSMPWNLYDLNARAKVANATNCGKLSSNHYDAMGPCWMRSLVVVLCFFIHSQASVALAEEVPLESYFEEQVAPYVQNYQDRLTTLFNKTKTPECRAKIADHYGRFMKALALEQPMPFSEVHKFNNTCEDEVYWDFHNLPEGVHMGVVQNRTYQPPRNETEYITPEQVVLCYGILAHDSAVATIRLIEALREPSTTFVVHVDGKPSYDHTQQALREYANGHPDVTLLEHPYRVRINWGGFSMVNATLQLFHFANQRPFTHFVHIASTAYPIASNQRIRNTLASYPKDANFFHVILRPAHPHRAIWNYFVECDDRLHRIYRLTPLMKETHDAEIYTTSQWFIMSQEFLQYMANPEPDSFLEQFLEYIEHVVVADESFFGTVLRHTPYCNKHHNWNFLHLQFDQWENERELALRDERKCVMPDPNHCGRSPTTMTLDYLDILEMSGDLFARKFNDEVDIEIKDALDTLRAKEQEALVTSNSTDPQDVGEVTRNMLLDGQGALIVAKDTMHTEMPMCLGLGEVRNKVRLVPCFEDWVPQTLSPDWETGAVILDETLDHNRWEIGPCSSDGNLERMEDGFINVTAGLYSPTGPRCMVRMMDGIRTGRCLDGDSLDVQPGGPVHVYPCTKRWNQYFAFGDGHHAPTMALHINVPKHTRSRIAETGRVQESYMCLGVAGRGDGDEEDWFGVREDDEDEDEDEEENSEEDEDTAMEVAPDGLPSLHRWSDSQLISTKCSNKGAIIEWVVVPFIVEQDESEAVAEEEDEEEL
eukprot:Nitzschia sp. Nitz4//scaffold253_size28098//4068//6740//NITZ4_008137-RA/size28098-snap-gene-0.33-mRNA-1//1//CDS//3329544288//324//frame0